MKTSLFFIAAVTAQFAAGQYYDEPRRSLLRAERGLEGHEMPGAKAEKVASEKASKSAKAKSVKSEKV